MSNFSANIMFIVDQFEIINSLILFSYGRFNKFSYKVVEKDNIVFPKAPLKSVS